MKKIKYGLIGFGGIAENRIAKEGFGLGLLEGSANSSFELIAAMDINPERASAAEYLGLKWYKSVEEMIADDEIEAVFISTNNASHAEIAKKAILKGKHCLIEKPIATSINDAEKLIELAVENRVSLMVDHMMRENSYNQEAKNLIFSGRIGAVDDIVLHMEFCYGSSEEEAATWRCSNPEELGGPIGDVGCHCLYMAEFLLGDSIAEISCIYTPKTLLITVENGAIIRFKTKKGIEGTARVAFNNNRGGLLGTLSNLGYEVYGSEGIIRSYGALFQLSGHAGEPYKIRVDLETADGLEQIAPDSVVNIYQKQIEQHAKSIRENNYSRGAEALHNLKMIFACHDSASTDSQFIKI